jgi:hypothetical protein
MRTPGFGYVEPAVATTVARTRSEFARRRALYKTLERGVETYVDMRG